MKCQTEKNYTACYHLYVKLKKKYLTHKNRLEWQLPWTGRWGRGKQERLVTKYKISVIIKSVV